MSGRDRHNKRASRKSIVLTSLDLNASDFEIDTKDSVLESINESEKVVAPSEDSAAATEPEVPVVNVLPPKPPDEEEMKSDHVLSVEGGLEPLIEASEEDSQESPILTKDTPEATPLDAAEDTDAGSGKKNSYVHRFKPSKPVHGGNQTIPEQDEVAPEIKMDKDVVGETQVAPEGGEEKEEQEAVVVVEEEAAAEELTGSGSRNKRITQGKKPPGVLNGEEDFEGYVSRLEKDFISEERLLQYGIDAQDIDDSDALECAFFGIASGQYQILKAIYQANAKGGVPRDGGEEGEGNSLMMAQMVKALEEYNSESKAISTLVDGFASLSIGHFQKMNDENAGIWRKYVDELTQSKSQVIEDNKKLLDLLGVEQDKNRNLQKLLEEMTNSMEKITCENAKLDQWLQVLINQNATMNTSRFNRSRKTEMADLSEVGTDQRQLGPPILTKQDFGSRGLRSSGGYDRNNAMKNRSTAVHLLKDRIKYK